MEQPDFDSKRRLCPDGTCVGVIGPDGLCSVCQGTASASAPHEETSFEPAVDDDADETLDAAADDQPTAAEIAGAGSSGFNPGRRLCDDGSCVGVIGPDGACGVCGQKAAV